MRPDERDAALIGAGVVLGAVAGAFGFWAFDQTAKQLHAAPGPGPGPAPAQRTDRVLAKPTGLVWLGPVSLAQVRGTDLPGVPVFSRPCTGDGKPSCGQLADGWTDAAGRKLPGLRRAVGAAPGPLVLAAFSAGGHVVKRVCADPRDRGELAGLVLADALYTTEWADQRAGRAQPIESIVAMAADAIADGRLLIATASSSPNKAYPTGAQTLAALVVALESRGHRGDVGAPSGLPAPARAWRANNVHLLDYGAQFTHEGHATALAPQIWRALVLPHFHPNT